ncbi:hypothetical protein JYU34_011351 [Plutella xylostella]|uniref:Uncharacterized protein n=1 Tax=Plutella xylostella TaxID=51655 RepID=A0ABQ7QI10_PLUXY|nr:hypothetical protein JYU34_011351 [Plutella xylostella]
MNQGASTCAGADESSLATPAQPRDERTGPTAAPVIGRSSSSAGTVTPPPPRPPHYKHIQC